MRSDASNVARVADTGQFGFVPRRQGAAIRRRGSRMDRAALGRQLRRKPRPAFRHGSVINFFVRMAASPHTLLPGRDGADRTALVLAISGRKVAGAA